MPWVVEAANLKWRRSRKIDRVRAPRGYCQTRFASRFSGNTAMRLQSMIGNTALIIEREMFGGRLTLRQ
jgi:hypothetical protein